MPGNFVADDMSYIRCEQVMDIAGPAVFTRGMAAWIRAQEYGAASVEGSFIRAKELSREVLGRGHLATMPIPMGCLRAIATRGSKTSRARLISLLSQSVYYISDPQKGR